MDSTPNHYYEIMENDCNTCANRAISLEKLEELPELGSNVTMEKAN